MRKLFRLRNLAIIALVATVIGVVVSRRSNTPAPAYPDPWVAPPAPGFPSSDATEAMSVNGLADAGVDVTESAN